jgi:hypothetical protein
LGSCQKDEYAAHGYLNIAVCKDQLGDQEGALASARDAFRLYTQAGFAAVSGTREVRPQQGPLASARQAYRFFSHGSTTWEGFTVTSTSTLKPGLVKSTTAMLRRLGGSA